MVRVPRTRTSARTGSNIVILGPRVRDRSADGIQPNSADDVFVRNGLISAFDRDGPARDAPQGWLS